MSVLAIWRSREGRGGEGSALDKASKLFKNESEVQKIEARGGSERATRRESGTAAAGRAGADLNMLQLCWGKKSCIDS